MNFRLVAAACLLLLLGNAGCREVDPLAVRLAQRSHYQIDVVGFSPRDDGYLLVELDARAGMGDHLPLLTVTIRQHGADQKILTSDRVTLDLANMDATGVLRVNAKVATYQGDLQSVSAVVEVTPPVSEYEQFPEILEVAGS